jgi:excisionase family DNA binding protein
MTTSLWSPAELAAHLNVPIKTIYVWRTNGTGPRGIRVGKHVRYRQADVDAWLDRQADTRRAASR